MLMNAPAEVTEHYDASDCQQQRPLAYNINI